MQTTPVIDAATALQRLREGNQRFAQGRQTLAPAFGLAQRAALTEGQCPFAIILGCSDSRVPAEIVFDQGLGDLFVIRVAGNIVAPSQVGSCEFAASQFGTRLIVVMGHSHCGAVEATIESLLLDSDHPSRNIESIVNRIRPSVQGLLATALKSNPDALLHEAIRANVRAAADHLRHGSEVIEELIHRQGVVVVGAEYSIETGLVDFFDGVPA